MPIYQICSQLSAMYQYYIIFGSLECSILLVSSSELNTGSLPLVNLLAPQSEIPLSHLSQPPIKNNFLMLLKFYLSFYFIDSYTFQWQYLHELVKLIHLVQMSSDCVIVLTTKCSSLETLYFFLKDSFVTLTEMQNHLIH